MPKEKKSVPRSTPSHFSKHPTLFQGMRQNTATHSALIHAEDAQSDKNTAMTTTKTATSMNHLDSSFTPNQGSPSGNDKQLMSAAAVAAASANVLSPPTPQLCCSTGSDNSSPDNHNTAMHFLPCLPPKIPRTIRAASPFEHLIHDRHLPKNGTISPLKVDEYIRETKQPPSSLHYMGERRDSTSSHLPPVPTEILIPTIATTQQELSSPTGKCPTSSSDDNQSWISNTYSSSGHHHHQEQKEQDYKTLYLCSQSDMYRLEQHNASVMEENRLLKRQLFEMQRQLYSYRRNNPFITTTTTMTSHKRRKISSNADADALATAAAAAPWFVPPSNLPQRSGTAGTVSAAAAARQALSQGGRGHVIVANSSNQRAVIKTPVRSNNQAIRFRRVSVREVQVGPPAAAAAGRAPVVANVVVAAVQQHLAMPQLTHAISAEEGETMVVNYKSG